MALIDTVKVVVPEKRLAQLTNKGLRIDTINDTVLTAVADQVEGLFLLEMGKQFRFVGITTEEGKLHDALGVQGTLVLLEKMQGVNSQDLVELYNAWINQLRRARNVTFRQLSPSSIDGFRANQFLDEAIQLEVSDQFGWDSQADRLPGLKRGRGIIERLVNIE